MSTEHDESGNEASPADTPVQPNHEPSDVTVAKINRSSALIAAVITGVVTLTGGIITAVVTYNVGVQHGAQAAGTAIVAPTSTMIGKAATPLTSPSLTQQSAPVPIASRTVSLTSLTPLSSSSSNDNENDPQTGASPQPVDTKPYPRVLYFIGGPCLYGFATYQLSYKYKHFETAVGLTDDSVVDGETFTVQVDQQPPTTVTIGPGKQPHPIDVDVTGGFRLTLNVQGDNACASGTSATAVWIDPTLTS